MPKLHSAIEKGDTGVHILLQATRELHAEMTGRQAAGDRDDARQRERVNESERRLNEVLREQYNDASRSGWR